MAEKTYLPNHEPLKSYSNVNYLDLEQHRSIWTGIIDSHPFNQSATVFLPSCSINVATQHMNQSLGSFYKIEAPLSFLLDPEFLQNYTKSDRCQIMMHSVDTSLNSDDVVVLSPTGQLCFSLVKETFETFGMEATARSKADVKHGKHVVMVDLKSPHFKAESKQYNRLKWCLENTLTKTFTLVVCAIDTLTGATIDINFPSAIIKSIVKEDMNAEFETLTEINIPSFQNITHTLDQKPQRWDDEAMQALEWLGLAHLKAKRIKQQSGKTDPFISVYQPPAPLLPDSHTGTLVKFKGFIPTSCIRNLMTVVRKMMISGVTSEWTSLTCWGYKDSPFTWNKMGHYEYLNSENDYTFLLLPNQKTAYVYQMFGSNHSKF